MEPLVAFTSLFTLCLLIGLLFAQFYCWQALFTRLDRLVEGKRLSTVFNLSPASLRIDPDRFAANKEKLKAQILVNLERRWSQRAGPVGPSNAADLILSESGWLQFVDLMAWTQARAALVRLMINDDYETARALCEELVDKL